MLPFLKNIITLFQIITFVLAVILITFSLDIKDAMETQMKRDDAETNMSSVMYTIVVMLVGLLFCKFFMDLVFVYAVYKVTHFIIYTNKSVQRIACLD